MAVLGLPLAAVVLSLALVLVLPGGGVLYAAWLALVGGLWCMGYMADAILLFGVSAMVFALGLILTYLGVWADVKLIGGYVRLVKWLARKLLGRGESEHA